MPPRRRSADSSTPQGSPPSPSPTATRCSTDPPSLRHQPVDLATRLTDLPRELGLPDLVLTQILFIVGLPWVGVAAKQGPAHVVFWLIAMALFYVPSAVVVMHLNRLMPLEGGLYQWAKLGFNELTGFLVAWNLWLFAILNTSETGIQVTQYASVHAGPRLELADRQARSSSRSSARCIFGGAGAARHSRTRASASGSTRPAAC